MYKKILLPFILIVLTCLSCTDMHDASPVYVKVTFSSRLVRSGDVMYLNLYAETLNNSITEVKVESFSPETGMEIIMEEQPGEKVFRKKMQMQVPSVRKDHTKIELIFSVSDDRGNFYEMSDFIIVDRGGAEYLREAGPFVLHSPATGKSDGFSLEGEGKVLDAGLVEDGLVDILFVKGSDAPDESLPLSWCTGTDVVFSKVPSFDYASATGYGVQVVLENSVRSNVVHDLAVDDIVLVGRESVKEDVVELVPCGALRIFEIKDAAGVANDRIGFFFKPFHM